MMTILIPVTVVLAATLLVAWFLPATAHVLRRRILLAGMILVVVLPLLRWALETVGLSLELPVDGPVAEGATGDGGVVTGAWLGTLWLCGSVVVLLRMMRRWAGMSALVRDSQPLSGEHDRVLQRLVGASQDVVRPEIRSCAKVATACVALHGWRPVVLLPVDAMRWPGRTLRAVLRHELEHARRGDVRWRLMGELAQAVWWWHPLVAVLLRRWTEACEHVCDEAVLRSGVRPQSYARSLLALASSTSAPSPAHAMAFTGRSPSRLRKRVASILQEHAPGSASPTLLGWCAMAALVVVIVMAATVRFSRQEAEAQSRLRSEAETRLMANPFPGDS